MPIASHRPDGRGHWPAGKRRSPPVPGWPALRNQLRKILASPYDRDAEGNCRSRRSLARYLGVDDRTVGRWVDGQYHPPAEYLPRIREWIAQ